MFVLSELWQHSDIGLYSFSFLYALFFWVFPMKYNNSNLISENPQDLISRDTRYSMYSWVFSKAILVAVCIEWANSAREE